MSSRKRTIERMTIAERKIKKAIEFCKKEIAESNESDYGAGQADAYDNVLTILGEGL